MTKRHFSQLLNKRWEKEKYLGVGLDPAFDLIPEWLKKQHQSVSEILIAYNRAIIDTTANETCIYKPNSAIYEAQGREGRIALEETIKYVNQFYPEIPIILDGKRNEIDRTNKYYADAITVNPWAGLHALKPFLTKEEHGAFILCRMTNPGSERYQEAIDEESL